MHGNFFSFKKQSYDRSLCSIPAKHTNYSSNGSGRDSYVVRTNGGFYPEQTIAAHTKTYVKQLRVSWERIPINKRNMERAKSSLIRKQQKFQRDEDIRTIQRQNNDELESVKNYFGSAKKSQTIQHDHHSSSVMNNDYVQQNVALKQVFNKKNRPQTASMTQTLDASQARQPRGGLERPKTATSLFNDIKERAPVQSGKHFDPKRKSAMRMYQDTMDNRLS